MREIATPNIFLKVPEIDFQSAYRYYLGNMENYKKSLLAVLKSTKSKLPILQSMCITGEYEGLRTLTQTISRMMTNIGAQGIADYSYHMEKILLNEDDDYLNCQLKDFIDCLYTFNLKLEQLLKDLEVNQSIIEKEEELSIRNYDFSRTKESIKLTSRLLDRKII